MKNILIAFCLFNLLAVFTDLDYIFLAKVLGLTKYIIVSPENLQHLLVVYTSDVSDFIFKSYTENGKFIFTLDETYDLYRKAINQAVLDSKLPMKPGFREEYFADMKHLVTDLYNNAQR